MTKKRNQAPGRKHPVFDTIDRHPRLLDEHARYMQSGGEQLLHAMTDSFRQDVWPWGMEVHAQASFGAFCAGVAWASRFLRQLPEINMNRREAIELMAAVGPSGLSDTAKDILRKQYQLTPDELAELDKKAEEPK